MSRSTERNPCQFCTAETGRSEGCHSNCQRYTEYRAQLDEANQRKAADRAADGVLIAGKQLHVRRVTRKSTPSGFWA